MAYKSNKKPAAGKNKAMSTTTRWFLAGFCAELYLLTVYRYYINGTVNQLLSWHDLYLPALVWVGLALLVIGLVLMNVGRKDCAKKWTAARILVGAGVFLAVTSPLILAGYDSALTVLCMIVPMVMILGILWHLYDRDCVYALMILCGTLLVLWLCRKGVAHVNRGMLARGVAVGWIVVLAAAALLLRKIQRADGVLKSVRVLPVNADYLPIYVAVGISVLLVAAAMVSAVIAYYALWAVAVAIFSMAVYYTVQQL